MSEGEEKEKDKRVKREIKRGRGVGEVDVDLAYRQDNKRVDKKGTNVSEVKKRYKYPRRAKEKERIKVADLMPEKESKAHTHTQIHIVIPHSVCLFLHSATTIDSIIINTFAFMHTSLLPWKYICHVINNIGGDRMVSPCVLSKSLCRTIRLT